MGSKIGLILSLPFIFLAFLFGVDLVIIQVQYSLLDSLTSYASYNIAKDGTISDSLKEFIKNNYAANIYCVNIDTDSVYTTGQTFEYCLEKDYEPIVLSSTYTIKITRCAIINYYG